MIEVTNHVARILSRVAAQFRRAPVLTALLTGIGTRAQALEDILWASFHGSALPNAEGRQLDVKGIKLGEAREGRADPDYQIAISVRIMRNNTAGEPWRLMEVFQFLTSADAVRIQEYGRVIVLMAVDGRALTCEEEARIVANMKTLPASGARLIMGKVPARGFTIGSEPGQFGNGFASTANGGDGGGLASQLREEC